MEPPSAKRSCLENSSDKFSQNDVAKQSVAQLPDDIVIYIGRFIVKYPALHLFFPASRKLAECAEKVFLDFAAKGGPLKFYSRDLLKAVQFAVAANLTNLNLSQLKAGETQDIFNFDPLKEQEKNDKEVNIAQTLARATYLTALNVTDDFWTRDMLPRFSSLDTLSLQNYKYIPNVDLEASTITLETSKLTRLSLAISSYRTMGDQPMPCLLNMPLLQSLKLSGLLLHEKWPKQIRTLSNLTRLDLAGHEDECNYDESLSEEEIRDLYATHRATFTNLTSLKLNDKSKVAWHLHVILDSLTSLRTLKLKRVMKLPESNPAEGSVASHLSKLICLEHLSLKNLQLDERVLESLQAASRLRDLCVSAWRDTFGRDSAKEYFTCIEALTALETLDLANQSLDFTSFQSLGKLTNLRKLHLGVVRSTPSGNFEEMKKLGQLTMLDLRWALKNVQKQSLALFSQLSSVAKLRLDSEDCGNRLPLASMSNLRKLHVIEHRSLTTQELQNMIALIASLTNLNTLHIGSFSLTLDLITSTCNQLSNLQKLGVPKLLFSGSDKQDESAKMHSLLQLKKIRLVRLKDNW